MDDDQKGEIKTHKSPNETQRNPSTKIKLKRVTCQKAELFFFFKKKLDEYRFQMSNVHWSNVRHQTADIGDRTSDIGQRTDVRCLMFDVQCPMSDV